jgi:hypothetical protein
MSWYPLIRITYLWPVRPTQLARAVVENNSGDMTAKVKDIVIKGDRLLAHPAAPIILTLLSNACFSTMDIMVQTVEKTGMDIGQIVSMRLASRPRLAI